VTPGNVELVQILASWAVTLPAVVAIIVRDERRLTGRERERSWPASSRDSAIFALWNLGVPHLSVLLHFVRTRRSVRGAAQGLLWLAGLVVCDVGAQLAVAAGIEWSRL
jgi:hypothetical protein